MGIKQRRRWFTSAAIATFASNVVVVIGAIGLLAWWFGVSRFINLSPNWPKMAPTGALALVLAGVALGLLRTTPVPLRRRRISTACASGVTLIGLLTLMQFAMGTSFGVDSWLALSRPDENTLNTYGSQSFIRGLLLFLVGPALMLIDVRPRRGPQPAQLLAVLAMHIVVFALIGYAFGNRGLYVLAASNDAGLGLLAAIALTFLLLGIFCIRPNDGLTRLLRSSSSGGVVARRLLLAPIAVPFVLGTLAWLAQKAGLFSPQFTGWMWAVSIFATIALIIWWVASVVQAADEKRAEAEATIRRMNQELELRVARRTAQLAETNRDLSHKNQENELFVYSVSHDLRSPLVNLQGFSKELEKTCHDLRELLNQVEVPETIRNRGLQMLDNDIAESVHFILTGVMRLSNIIDALLRLSRAGRVEYQWQQVDVNSIVKRVIESSHGSIQKRGAAIAVRDLPPVWGDPTALEQLFANLIGNAVNYLDDARPGEIEIGCRNGTAADPNTRLYYVKDNGLGIPQAHQAKIFQAFQRAHPAAAKGEGIGLAIVRRVIDRHLGKIWVESQPGEGSTFFAELPIQSHHSDRSCTSPQEHRHGH